MDIFESLESLPVSEACFEDIVGLVEEYLSEEGIMQDIKNGMSPEEAKQNFLDKSNRDFIETKKGQDKAFRLYRNAYYKNKKGLVSPETVEKLSNAASGSEHLKTGKRQAKLRAVIPSFTGKVASHKWTRGTDNTYHNNGIEYR